jgi:cystathionine beta-lyase/cystathionine gamma-synthase
MSDDKPLKPDDICPQPVRRHMGVTIPLAPELIPTSVWCCPDPDTADAVLGGQESGYVYQRDGHPNSDWLAEKLCALHGAASGVVTASGMAALALALVWQTQPGDRVLVSMHVYGKTLQLLYTEGRRWGVETELFDPLDMERAASLLERPVRLMVLETVSNPCLRVPDIRRWSDYVHEAGGTLLVDNTFATPVLCRPLEWGADLVMESVSKLINGHSDVMLGFLGGAEEVGQEITRLCSLWGWTASPWDCWLALRGLASLHVRVERACQNALEVARWLLTHPKVKTVYYPGLPQHPDHDVARQQLGGRFGSMVTFELWGGRSGAAAFIRAAAPRIPFCPSLGEISTTLSHPESTSHRGLSGAQRAALGVTGGTLRLSCGIESLEYIIASLKTALDAVA